MEDHKEKSLSYTMFSLTIISVFAFIFGAAGLALIGLADGGRNEVFGLLPVSCEILKITSVIRISYEII